jgi:hypothetical protein
MSTFYCKKLISIIVVVAVVAAVLILPLGNFTVHAAGTPWVRFVTSKDVKLPKGTFTVIRFKSENIIATSAAVSVTSNNSAVKVYNTMVNPGKTAGFSGRVVVKGITAGKSADLKISVSGDASIADDIISAIVNGDVDYFHVVSNTATTSENYTKLDIYLKRGKTASLSGYVTSSENYLHWKNPYSLFWNDYSVPSTKVKWKTSNKNIVTVSKRGVVKVNKKASYGKYAIITATYSWYSVKYYVHVLKKTKKVTKLSYVGNRTKTMPVMGTRLLNYDATFGKGGANAKVTWSSSNESVLEVNSRGMLKAKNAGIANITVKSGSKSLTYTINVLSIPDFVEWSDSHGNDYFYDDNYDD